MRKDFKNKPYIYPQPVLIIATFNEDNTANAMNAAWGGVADDDKIFMCLSKEHKTIKNILKRKAFTVSIGTLKTLAESDYFGIVSGNKVKNKVEQVNFHIEKSKYVNAPIILEYPLTLECELISYDENTCALFGKIINTNVDESILSNGKIDPNKLQAISFDIANAKYLLVKDVVGNAFKDGTKLIK